MVDVASGCRVECEATIPARLVSGDFLLQLLVRIAVAERSSQAERQMMELSDAR